MCTSRPRAMLPVTTSMTSVLAIHSSALGTGFTSAGVEHAARKRSGAIRRIGGTLRGMADSVNNPAAPVAQRRTHGR